MGLGFYRPMELREGPAQSLPLSHTPGKLGRGKTAELALDAMKIGQEE